jgi:hypothetical protein
MGRRPPLPETAGISKDDSPRPTLVRQVGVNSSTSERSEERPSGRRPEGGKEEEIAVMLKKTPEQILELQRKLYQKAKQDAAKAAGRR